MDIKKNEYYQTWLKNPWSYVTGAVILAVLNIAHMAATGGKAWGVSGAFANWGAWVYQLFGGHPEKWDYYVYLNRGFSKLTFWTDGSSIRNVGVIVGALLATLLASQFKFKKIKSWRQIVAAVIGGLLMGYGARLSFGCNIGALFGGVSSMSLHGYLFIIFIFLGAVVGSKLLVKYFM